MTGENNVAIDEIYQSMLYNLRTYQNNYERMLKSGVLNDQAKDKILNLLMEVDYQIRDYEELSAKVGIRNNPVYLENNIGEIPIIKSRVIREKLSNLENRIVSLEETFDSVQKHKMLRTEYGRDIHSKLYSLDAKQKAMIIQELTSERRHVTQLIRLRRAVRIYKTLNKIEEIQRQINYNQETIEIISDPNYIHPKLKITKDLSKLNKKIKELKTKKGKLKKHTNRLINKPSLLDIPNKMMEKIAYTLK